jgi:ATP-dependent DNA ligase
VGESDLRAESNFFVEEGSRPPLRNLKHSPDSACMLMRSPLARERRRPAGFVLPCQPTLSDKVPSGTLWLHEIKHDGYRLTPSLWARAPAHPHWLA